MLRAFGTRFGAALAIAAGQWDSVRRRFIECTFYERSHVQLFQKKTFASIHQPW